MDFYVIANSDENSDSVTLLKAEPLKSEEMKDLISVTEVADKISLDSTFSLDSTYLHMAYYTSDTCVSAGDKSGCLVDYDTSSIKQVVDVWSKSALTQSDLKEDILGYKTRLITFDELLNNLGYTLVQGETSQSYESS